MKRKLSAILAICSLSLLSPAALAEPADIAGALANPDRIESDIEQDETRQADRLLAFAGLERGDHVFDYIAAAGYYSELIARAVGEDGYVFSHNEPQMIERFELRAALDARGYGDRLPNAESLEVATDDLRFEPDSLDLVLMNQVFHDMWWVPVAGEAPVARDPAGFLERLYRAVKPGGAVVIVDHVGQAGASPMAETARAHRIDPAAVRRMMEAAGFELQDEADYLRNPADDLEANIFDPSIRGSTDRFIYLFVKPLGEA